MHNTHAEFVGLQIDCLAAMKRQSLKSVRKKLVLGGKKQRFVTKLLWQNQGNDINRRFGM